MKCKYYIIKKVFINNESALNVFLGHILDKLLVDMSYMRQVKMISRDYNGSSRQVIGNIDIELIIRSHPLYVTLKVLDIQFFYSILLG
jgi:hypothetical protein